MLRIYVDNNDDEVTLLSEGTRLRGNTVKFPNTYPNRLDGELTTIVRVKDIPLSVHDDTISRALLMKGLIVIEIKQEELRYKGKLTNCVTGDRLFIIKKSSLTVPLPKFMPFGHFTGRVMHPGQNTDSIKFITCKKYLQDGHNIAECTNDWRYLDCDAVGHKRGQCGVPGSESEHPSQNSAVPQTVTLT